ncbi:MAG: START domain-containing protein [Myxococcota bacterium]
MRSLYLVLLVGSTASAADWRADGEVDGVKIELRPVEGSKFEEARLTTTSDAPLAALCDAVLGKNAPPAEEDGVKKREVLKDTDTERITYEQLALPLVSDRDYVLHLKVEKPASSGRCEISVTTEDDPAHPPAPGHVRMKFIRAYWTLVPNEKGTVDITYVLHSDPGGSVPAIFTRLGARRAAVDSMKKILARAKAPTP